MTHNNYKFVKYNIPKLESKGLFDLSHHNHWQPIITPNAGHESPFDMQYNQIENYYCPVQ